MDIIYDCIIVGSGPAGMTAAIYAKRFNLNVLVLEHNAPGGAMVNTLEIANYPGFLKISGVDLSMNMYNQMMASGPTYQACKVLRIDKKISSDNTNDIFIVTTDGLVYQSKTVIIATGTSNKKLNIPSENKYLYNGISWCAICDGPLYKNKDVCVIGGGNSAFDAAITLTNFVNKVYLIHRRDSFRADKVLIDKVMNNPKIELIVNSNVIEFIGDDKLKQVKVQSFDNISLLDVSCCFEEIGRIPNSDFITICDKTIDGYIIVDEDFMTSSKGIYACGDVVNKKIRQVATAVNDGAICALAVSKYLS